MSGSLPDLLMLLRKRAFGSNIRPHMLASNSVNFCWVAVVQTLKARAPATLNFLQIQM